MWMRDAVHARQVPDDQAAHERPALLPVSLRPGAVGVRRRTLGRSRDRRRLPHRAAPRLGSARSCACSARTRTRCRRTGPPRTGRCTCRRSRDARTRTASASQARRARSRAATTTSRRRSAPTASCSRSSRAENLFSIDLFVGDAATGKVIKKLGGPSSDPHFDAISFINSAGDWSPDSDKFAFIVYAEGANEIAILDTKSTNVERRIKLPGDRRGEHVSWSPDGRTLAFSGQAGGISDLYLLDLASGNDQAAHERPVRRHSADVVAGRQDDRLRDAIAARRRTSRRSSSRRCSWRRTTSRRGTISVFSPLRARQAHQPAVLAGRSGSLLRLRSGRLPGHLSRCTSRRPGLPRDARLDGRQRHHDDLAGALGRRARRAGCCSTRSTIRATRFAARRVA